MEHNKPVTTKRMLKIAYKAYFLQQLRWFDKNLKPPSKCKLYLEDVTLTKCSDEKNAPSALSTYKAPRTIPGSRI